MACKKDKDVLGVTVQPADDALTAQFSETAPVYAYTMPYDSILSWNNRYKYLGINKDPYFGTTDVGLYVRPSIPDGKTFVNFGTDASLSSSEIILAVNNLGISHVGNPNAQVSYSIFPVSTSLDPAKAYGTSVYNNYHSTNAVLGVFTGSYSSLSGKPVLRIPVDNNFARAILTNPQYLVDNVAYQSIYKGFYIKSSLNADEGLITQFDVEDDLSGFYLYYQNGMPPATKSDKVFRFPFGGTGPVRYNTVKHSYQGANSTFVQQVVNKDTTQGKDGLFLKGLGISKVRLYLPTLKNYSDSFTVAVNRAELVLHLDPAVSLANYTPPGKLMLLAADSAAKEIYALDQLNATDAARYGGTYDEEGKRYVFNIARHVQAVLSGKRKNFGFYLVIANTDNLLFGYNLTYYGSTKELSFLRRDDYVERVVLAGSNHPSLKPVLNLSYIKLRHD